MFGKYFFHLSHKLIVQVVDNEEVAQLLKSLDGRKSTGEDKIESLSMATRTITSTIGAIGVISVLVLENLI